MTSSHPSSPSKGVRTDPARTPCRGLRGRTGSRMLGRWFGVLLAGGLVLVGCQRPVVPSEAEAAPATRAAGRLGGGRAAGVDHDSGGRGRSPSGAGRAAAGPVDGGAWDRPGGWYELGPRPGEAGPAVIVGHVDSRSGPAVFFRLGQLRRGDKIVVGQAGGGARPFLVERVERQAKEALPVERIWNRTNQPVLRLITCGGSFDRSTGHYRDNIIVYARRLVDSVM